MTELANFIASEGVVAVDWEVNSIVNNYKGKGGIL